MATRLTATQVARKFSDILNRVRYRGEEFDIERNGEVVARLGPAPHRKGTVRELLELIARHGADPAFADDLEQVQSNQPKLGKGPWDT